MDTPVYLAPAMALFTYSTIRVGVMLAPEGILTGSAWSTVRTLTLVPPTSMTTIFGLAAFFFIADPPLHNCVLSTRVKPHLTAKPHIDSIAVHIDSTRRAASAQR